MHQGVINPKETNRRRMKLSGGSTRSDKSALGKTMSTDDKKIKTNPAPKNEVPLEDKSTSGVDTSKAEGGKVADASPSGYSRGEGQKPVSKAIRTTGTRFSPRKRSDNSAAFFASITDAFFAPANRLVPAWRQPRDSTDCHRAGSSTVARKVTNYSHTTE